jgi:hypothetical protein
VHPRWALLSAKNKRKGEADTTDVGHGNKSNTEEPKEKDSLEGQFFADEGPYGICLLHNAITVSQILDDPTEVSKTIFPPGVIYEISNDANEKNKGLAVSIKFVLEKEFKKLRLKTDPNGQDEHFYTNSVKLLENGDKPLIYVSKENLDRLDIASVSRMKQSLQSIEKGKER